MWNDGACDFSPRLLLRGDQIDESLPAELLDVEGVWMQDVPIDPEESCPNDVVNGARGSLGRNCRDACPGSTRWPADPCAPDRPRATAR